MEYRELGRTGLRVSEIGYGAWAIGASGWIGAEEDESVRALHRAIDLGVNFIDTARGYGERAHRGHVVRERAGDEVYVATKVPPKNGRWPAPDRRARSTDRGWSRRTGGSRRGRTRPGPLVVVPRRRRRPMR